MKAAVVSLVRFRVWLLPLDLALALRLSFVDEDMLWAFARRLSAPES